MIFSRRHTSVSHGSTPKPGSAGFTLPEVLIASTVFIFLLGGIVSANLFGLRMFQIANTKITATDDARRAMGRLASEIRSCKSTFVGEVQSGTFQARLDGEAQVGSGLLIYPSTNTADYIVYFVNPSDQTFRRTTSATGNALILAESVTNDVVFSAQDHSGNVLTNNQGNRVIHFNLEFQQPESYTRIADYYRVETAVTRRVLE